MDDSVHHIDRIVMVGHMGGLTAAALVDDHVYEYGTRPHLLEVFLLHDLRCRCARIHQHAADDEVRFLYCRFHIGIVRYQSLDMEVEDLLELLEPLGIDVKDRDIRSHAECDLRCVHADVAAAEDDDVRLRCARYAAEQDSPSAVLGGQDLRAFLCAQASRDTAHRDQQRQALVRRLHGLICHALYLALDQGVRLRLVCCKVQVGVQDQSFMEQRVLLRERLLDLDHHLGKVPHFLCGSDQLCACRLILGVCESAPETCACFYIYFMSCADVCFCIVRCHAYAELFILDFLYTSDSHGYSPSLV